jgi:hypothetical protein
VFHGKSRADRPALAALIAAFLAVAGLTFASPAAAQAPELTVRFPEEGAILAEPPTNIHLCFSRPVDVADDADFRFLVTTPLGTPLGARIVFQPDGLGVDMMPGILPEEPPEGDWTFEYRVTDVETKEPLQGVINYQVAPGGAPLPQTFDRCTGEETPPPDPSDQSGDDDGSDTLVIAVIVALVGVALVSAGVIVYALRRRSGGRAAGS